MTVEELHAVVMAERAAGLKRTEAIRAYWSQNARDAWDDMSDAATALLVAQRVTDDAFTGFVRDAPVTDQEYEEIIIERDLFADRATKLYDALASVAPDAARMIVEST